MSIQADSESTQNGWGLLCEQKAYLYSAVTNMKVVLNNSDFKSGNLPHSSEWSVECVLLTTNIKNHLPWCVSSYFSLWFECHLHMYIPEATQTAQTPGWVWFRLFAHTSLQIINSWLELEELLLKPRNRRLISRFWNENSSPCKSMHGLGFYTFISRFRHTDE